jgi:proton glutamate symport protein
VPTSFFDAAAKNEVLQVVFFTVLFAIALARVPAPKREPLLKFFESLNEVMFKFTDIVMRFAPIGIFAAMAATIGASGVDVLLSLGKLVLTLYVALVVFVLAALVLVALLFRIPLRAFWKRAREPWLIAFDRRPGGAAARDGEHGSSACPAGSWPSCFRVLV